MDLDPRFIQVLILVVVVFVAIARLFFRVFVKPFVPPSPPGGLPPVRRAPRQHEIKDFLEELRRDLGHGEPPAPRRGDGLMDEEKPVESHAESAREEEVAHAEVPPPEIPRAFRPQPPRPVAQAPAPFAAEKAARQESARMDEVARRRVLARREAIARADKAAALLEQRAGEVQASAVVSPVADSLSAPGLGSKDASQDNVLGVDLEQAVILQQILGPPHCRQPRRPRLPPPAPAKGRR